MNTSDIDKKLKIVKSEYIKKLGDRLIAIILCGSYPTSSFNADWSDIDLILVCRTFDFRSKTIISKIKNRLEILLSIEIGINLVTTEEVSNDIKINSAAILPGKVLQALYELTILDNRIIHLADNFKFYKPTKRVVKKYCVDNIIYFLNRSRKEMISKKLDELTIPKICLKEIRAVFTISKLACQYMILNPIVEKNDTIIYMKKLFPTFDSSILQKNHKLASDWKQRKSFNQYLNILEQNEKFIEEFSRYFLEFISIE